MNLSRSADKTASPIPWFCVHTQSKREHIAAGWLRVHFGIETYLPRIRFRQNHAGGSAWATEALFPTYVFARFELGQWIQRVGTVPGVIGVVRFGSYYPPIPGEVIENLRSRVGQDEVHVIDSTFTPGDSVQIATGPFQGLEAVITRVFPARQRVNVLLDMLGRQTNVDVETSMLVSTADTRLGLLGSNG